jgi:hypothetical protein
VSAWTAARRAGGRGRLDRAAVSRRYGRVSDQRSGSIPNADPSTPSVLAIRPRAPSTFGPVDDAGAEDWQPDGADAPLDYLRIAALAWHLRDLTAGGRLEAIVPVLDEAERMLANGDQYTRELIKIGLLEDLQNAGLQSDGAVQIVQIRGRLGPRSQAAWDELMRSWHGPESNARKILPPGSLPG